MGWPSWGELTAMVVPVAGGFGWWVKRRDRVSTLEAEVKELKSDITRITTQADKARRTQEETIADLKLEIAEWRRQVERREDRIEALEDRLYTKGGTT